jgi:hypothetical protein
MTPARGGVLSLWEEAIVAHAFDGNTGRAQRRRFVRHYLEMVVAMFGGMLIFGGLVSLFCALTDHQGLLDHPGASAPIMATNMTIGMTLWMRYRGHGWAAIAEMAAAMYVPLALLLVPFWAGVLPGGALLGAVHVMMLPAMFLVMLRRRGEYSQDHRSHVHLPLAVRRSLGGYEAHAR